MRVFYTIGLLLLINGKVNNSPTPLDEQEIHRKFEEWLNKKVDDLINEITESRAHANSLLDKQIVDGQFGVQQLEILKSGSISQLLHCDRLKEGVKDIGKMFKETFNVALDVGKLVKDTAFGLAKCSRGNKIKLAFCIAKYVWKVSEEVSSIVPAFKTYGMDISRLANEVKDVYEYCMHQ